MREEREISETSRVWWNRKRNGQVAGRTVASQVLSVSFILNFDEEPTRWAVVRDHCVSKKPGALVLRRTLHITRRSDGWPGWNSPARGASRPF
jgi:hypothetical protein